ncbi:hypothetical protein TI39_contig602g00006 [Zymoseptoria brevis]|uniref:Uncharacterized protein n=1 Tax=Zymoseptoria brevis TaxID=1047168 RepID=A0A0F4GKM1_9PEZI|nr:hypothetical protein TI39_contig602g00006 [Zymoseptoria brevis]
MAAPTTLADAISGVSRILSPHELINYEALPNWFKRMTSEILEEMRAYNAQIDSSEAVPELLFDPGQFKRIVEGIEDHMEGGTSDEVDKDYESVMSGDEDVDVAANDLGDDIVADSDYGEMTNDLAPDMVADSDFDDFERLEESMEYANERGHRMMVLMTVYLAAGVNVPDVAYPNAADSDYDEMLFEDSEVADTDSDDDEEEQLDEAVELASKEAYHKACKKVLEIDHRMAGINVQMTAEDDEVMWTEIERAIRSGDGMAERMEKYFR